MGQTREPIGGKRMAHVAPAIMVYASHFNAHYLDLPLLDPLAKGDTGLVSLGSPNKDASTDDFVARLGRQCEPGRADLECLCRLFGDLAHLQQQRSPEISKYRSK
jgi:hypothetical protein